MCLMTVNIVKYQDRSVCANSADPDLTAPAEQSDHGQNYLSASYGYIRSSVQFQDIYAF